MTAIGLLTPMEYYQRLLIKELEGGKVLSASDAVEQLQKGADQADGWLPSKLRFEFVPVLVHGKIHKIIRTQLRSRKVWFRGRLTQVKLLKCGAQLTTVLG